MRLLLLVILTFSFAAYGQRVKENIKQSAGVQSDVKGKVKKPVRR